MSLDASKPWANGVKRGDQNDTRVLNVSRGRWMLIVTRMYVGDSYGFVGSDGWTLRVTLVRNPKAAA